MPKKLSIRIISLKKYLVLLLVDTPTDASYTEITDAVLAPLKTPYFRFERGWKQGTRFDGNNTIFGIETAAKPLGFPHTGQTRSEFTVDVDMETGKFIILDSVADTYYIPGYEDVF